MKSSSTNTRTCKNGHIYHKTSDCPTCPTCDKERKPKDGFLSILAAPARRALESKGITTLNKLSTYSEQELLLLHGLGQSSVPKLKKALASEGLELSQTDSRKIYDTDKEQDI